MERRDLLRSAALGATLALLPPFLRRAFGAADGICNADAARPMLRVLERARRRGKPFLSLVVPAGEEERSLRARAFAELIDLGSERDVAMLALTEVACAPLEVLRCLVPAASHVPDDAVLLLIDQSTTPATVRVLPAVVPLDPEFPVIQPYSQRIEAAFHQRTLRARIASLSTPLRRTLAGAELGRWARINTRALDPADRERVRTFATDPGAVLPIGLADAGAPLLLASALATHQGDARRRAIGRLASVTRWRLQERPPPGGRWLRLEGCGDYAVRARRDQIGAMACGLSSFHFLSARFLDFHTAPGD